MKTTYEIRSTRGYDVISDTWNDADHLVLRCSTLYELRIRLAAGSGGRYGYGVARTGSNAKRIQAADMTEAEAKALLRDARNERVRSSYTGQDDE